MEQRSVPRDATAAEKSPRISGLRPLLHAVRVKTALCQDQELACMI
jgi:hypothetical protein